MPGRENVVFAGLFAPQEAAFCEELLGMEEARDNPKAPGGGPSFF